MYNFKFLLIFQIILMLHYCCAEKKGKAGPNDTSYKVPCNTKHPYGDEKQMDTNILEKEVNKVHCADQKPMKDLEGKCPLVESTADPVEPYIPCPIHDVVPPPHEIIFSSNLQPSPEVQCKKCDLKLTADNTAVIVECSQCYDLPSPNRPACWSIEYRTIMWSKRIVSYVNPKSPLQKTLRAFSQVTEPKIETGKGSDVRNFRVGENNNGFQVKAVKEILELRIIAIYLVHKKTKAQYLHLYRNDNNNVFSINFRTTPMDSTGLPHVLEHTVLCGSELYPVRDPFFKMLNRSLATFMNAMTGSDYTMYPFSTQNYSDYKNLQKIYLDAVFRPNLKELDLMQEGWRLEHIIANDNKTDIIIKGVVYNEMKGVFAENENILGQILQNLILPDHTYGFISGGDPMEIPNITWNNLKAFHKAHYHPSNCRMYSYGNFPLSPSLEYIDNEYFSKYVQSDPSTSVVPSQKRWKERKKQNIACRVSTDFPEIQNTVTISLLLSDNTNVYDTFLMQFLTELLIKGPNAPFYKSMIEPNFSGGFTPTTGFDGQPRDTILTIGLQGVKKKDFDKVIQLFDDTINNIVKSGFEAPHIEAILHRYELAVKHESNNFGLNLLFNITPLWNHSEEIVSALELNKLIDRLKTELKADPNYLSNIVRQYIKDNEHRLIIIMSPDQEFESKLAEAEKELIKKKTKDLTDDDKKNIYERNLEIQKQHLQPAKIDILPTLSIIDINSHVEKIDKVLVTIHNVPTQINRVNTNGIVYFKAVLNTNELSPEEQMQLPLFCYVINKLGTDKLNYLEFDNLINRKTGGLTIQNHVAESLFHLHMYEPGILLSSYCLEKNVESMWDIWNLIFSISKPKDIHRFQTLVQLYVANLTNGIADAGHIYAMQAASSLVCGSAQQVERLTGLQHISYMKRLVRNSHPATMLHNILNTGKILFNKKKMRVSLNISPENQTKILHSYENFIMKLPEPGEKLTPNYRNTYVIGKVWASSKYINCQHHVLNVPINYCSKAVLTVPYTHPDFPKLSCLARLLSNKYLHPELRGKQGAYGGGAKLMSNGVFSCFSYRDPRNLETLNVFDNSLKWIKEQMDKITDQDIFEAKLGVFQSVDAPVPPSKKGNEEFLKRLTPDIKQRYRAALMTVDKEGLKSVADKYLGSENILKTGKVVIGPKDENMNITKRDHELWVVMDT